VFLKVFRGVQQFNGGSSLKTWVYRIAVHEASNRKRWWCRHKSHEMSIEPEQTNTLGLKDMLVDEGQSPLENVAQRELKRRVEEELRHVAEPYRTTVILRDIEELSYEEIAEVMQTTLGTVKSRLTRGREALKKRLERHLGEIGAELGISVAERVRPKAARNTAGGQEVEVVS
jgi:RNA polymerase sigma-70 factor (ECF subfamily)